MCKARSAIRERLALNAGAERGRPTNRGWRPACTGARSRPARRAGFRRVGWSSSAGDLVGQLLSLICSRSQRVISPLRRWYVQVSSSTPLASIVNDLEVLRHEVELVPRGPRKWNQRSGASLPVAYLLTCRLWLVSRRATRKRSMRAARPSVMAMLSASPVSSGPPGTASRGISGDRVGHRLERGREHVPGDAQHVRMRPRPARW